MLWILRSLRVLPSVRAKINMSNRADVSHAVAMSMGGSVSKKSKLDRKNGEHTDGAGSGGV